MEFLLLTLCLFGTLFVVWKIFDSAMKKMVDDGKLPIGHMAAIIAVVWFACAFAIWVEG